MPAACVALIGASALLQVVGGRFCPLAWLVPDLTLVAMIVTVLRDPSRALAAGGTAGVCALLLSFPHAGMTALGYLGLAGLIAWTAGQWDLLEPARQRGVVAASEAGLWLAWMLSDHLLSWFMLLAAIVRIGLTVACLPLWRRFMAAPTA